MKEFFILLLCSVACCFASHSCSEKEMQKCSMDPVDVSDLSKKGVEKHCKQLKCWIGVYEKCKLYKNEEGRQTLRQYKRAFDVTCDKKNPLREKLLRNLKCITEAMKSDESRECRLQLEITDHQLYCKKLEESLDCLYNIVFQTCGQDARDAFVAVYPDGKYAGCP